VENNLNGLRKLGGKLKAIQKEFSEADTVIATVGSRGSIISHYRSCTCTIEMFHLSRFPINTYYRRVSKDFGYFF